MEIASLKCLPIVTQVHSEGPTAWSTCGFFRPKGPKKLPTLISHLVSVYMSTMTRFLFDCCCLISWFTFCASSLEALPRICRARMRECCGEYIPNIGLDLTCDLSRRMKHCLQSHAVTTNNIKFWISQPFHCEKMSRNQDWGFYFCYKAFDLYRYSNRQWVWNLCKITFTWCSK